MAGAGHADSPAQALFTMQVLEGGAALLTMPTWGMYHSQWDWRKWLDAALDEAIERKSPALIIDLRRVDTARLVKLHRHLRHGPPTAN